MCRTKDRKGVIKKAARELRDDRDAQRILEKRRFEVEIDAKKQEQRLQKWFAYWAVGLVSVWLVFVAVLLVLVGMSRISLSNGVLMTLLATTTVNVIACQLLWRRDCFQTSSFFIRTLNCHFGEV